MAQDYRVVRLVNSQPSGASTAADFFEQPANVMHAEIKEIILIKKVIVLVCFMIILLFKILKSRFGWRVADT